MEVRELVAVAAGGEEQRAVEHLAFAAVDGPVGGSGRGGGLAPHPRGRYEGEGEEAAGHRAQQQQLRVEHRQLRGGVHVDRRPPPCPGPPRNLRTVCLCRQGREHVAQHVDEPTVDVWGETQDQSLDIAAAPRVDRPADGKEGWAVSGEGSTVVKREEGWVSKSRGRTHLSTSTTRTSCRLSGGMSPSQSVCVPSRNGTGACTKSKSGAGTTGRKTCVQLRG